MSTLQEKVQQGVMAGVDALKAAAPGDKAVVVVVVTVVEGNIINSDKKDD